MTVLAFPTPPESALPVAIPRRPFTIGEARAAGVTDKILQRAVRRGLLRRILRGVYVPSELEDTPELRAFALSLVVGPHQVVVDRSAAWLHGVDCLTGGERASWVPIETCALRGSTRTRRSECRGRTRDLTVEDVGASGGLMLTTPLRTALDLGCGLQARDAFAAMNGLAALHDFGAADLVRELPRFVGRRGVIQLRALAPHVDPRPESPRESWTLLELIGAGLPRPELQYEVGEDGRCYRLDLAYPAQRVCIEYNGFEFHEATQGQREYDEERRRWLRDRGWTIVEVRLGDFTGHRLDRWLLQVREALATAYSNRRW